MRLFLALFFAYFQAADAGMFDSKLLINGAGATFPYPLYSKWFSEYQKLAPEIAFNYQSIGSGGGIRQFLDETVDFGASDAPMNDEQLKKAKYTVHHVPAVMGAVVLTFNLPSLASVSGTTHLRLNGLLVADIFLGKVKKWSDPRILDLNPELKDALIKSPDQDILVVHRSDGSGTTSIFSEFLSKSSDEWKTKVGKGTALRWPTGIGGKGNEGVTAFVKQIPGSIGYVELVFAKTLKLPYANLENPRHEFVEPSAASVTAAAEGALSKIPDDFRMSITLVDAPNAYPISSFTYLLIYERTPEQYSSDKEKTKGAHTLKFVDWGLTEGQKICEKMNYAPLPAPLIERIRRKLKLIPDSVAIKTAAQPASKGHQKK